MKIIHLTPRNRLSFGGGSLVQFQTQRHLVSLTQCRGWLWQRGWCHIHVRGFGLGLTINHPARVVG
jgi:hypothetical protein